MNKEGYDVNNLIKGLERLRDIHAVQDGLTQWNKIELIEEVRACHTKIDELEKQVKALKEWITALKEGH